MNKTTEQILVNFQHLKTDGWQSSGQFQSAVAISELMYFFDISLDHPKHLPTPTTDHRQSFHTFSQIILEPDSQRCFIKKVFLKISQNSQENTCVRVSFLIKASADSGADVFLWILWILKNTYFYRTPLVAASVIQVFPFGLCLALANLSWPWFFSR